MIFIPFFFNSKSTEPKQVSQFIEIEPGDVCQNCSHTEFIVVCAKCKTELPVNESEDETESNHWAVKLILIGLLILFLITWFCGWMIHCDVYPEYKGTFVQYVDERVSKIIEILKRIW